MTLASSGAITSAQINTETGEATFDMGGTAERNLAGRPSGSYSWDAYWGQTGGGIVTEQTTGSFDTNAGGLGSTTINFGATAWNRRIFVNVHWACDSDATETFISSATIGGVAATIHVHMGEGGGSAFTNYGCGIISATVPTGSSGTIAIQLDNAAVYSVFVTPYRVTGLVSAIASDIASDFDETVGAGTATASLSLAMPGFEAVGFFATTFSSAGTLGNITTTGLIERAEGNMTQLGRYSNGYRDGLGGGSVAIESSAASDVTCRIRCVAASFQIH